MRKRLKPECRLSCGAPGHGPAQAICTFADGRSRFVRHSRYLYGHTECQAMNNTSKLLMPSW